MKKIILTTIAVFAFSTTMLFAQPTPGGRPGSGVGDNDDETAPVATATMLLLGLGGGFAAYKIKHKKK
ncbi:MAG: hypothetical protein LBO06_08410 [Bacteroidales bacterium]|jgi:hypothetical protein|nr:hypothetical protein [Bacteroidales bacterium]